MRELTDPLLARIFADPDSDEARAVYADALVERGDPRGELIQLQLSLARERPRSDAWGTCAAAVDRLLWAHRERWLPKDAMPVVMARGFVERAGTVRPGTLGLLAGNPIREVAIARPTSARELPETVIKLDGDVPVELAHAVLPRLQHITLFPERLDALASAPTPRLRSLRLFFMSGARLSDDQLARIAELQRFELSVRWSSLPPLFGRLVALPNLRGLGVDQLRAALPPLPRLDWLEVGSSVALPAQLGGARRLQIAAASAERIASLEALGVLATVEELVLEMTDRDALQLLARAHTPALRTLAIRHSDGGHRWCDVIEPIARRVDALDVRSLRGDNELGALPGCGLASLAVPTILPSTARRIVAAPASLGRVRHDMRDMRAAEILDARWPPIATWMGS